MELTHEFQTGNYQAEPVNSVWVPGTQLVQYTYIWYGSSRDSMPELARVKSRPVGISRHTTQGKRLKYIYIYKCSEYHE